tara:strand:- start:1200 stop:1595 length:396 start_codon:yes stop_codon:yes gene_type:complete
MTTVTYALCAGRHDIVVDGEDVTEKSVYPQTVERPLDFETHIAEAREFLIGLTRDEKLMNSISTFRLVVTGLTPVLHAFLRAWHTLAPSHWVLSLGHYDRDEQVYVWEPLFTSAIDMSSLGRFVFVPYEEE